jgi:hypothetical protein
VEIVAEDCVADVVRAVVKVVPVALVAAEGRQ